jgi:NTE family protein
VQDIDHRRQHPGTVPPRSSNLVGWVFAGGGARGAYEVGVCTYLFDRIAAELGRPLPIDVLSGTSIGAIHACALAAWADDPAHGAALLAERWIGLSLDDVIRVDRKRTFNMFRGLLGWSPRKPSDGEARGGMLDARPLEALLSSTIDFARIAGHLAAGRVQAVSVTATHVGTGRTSVFFQEQPGRATRWEGGHQRAVPVALGPVHALASASIPFLFPAVAIGSELYCDGSLRQHVPLSPARHLGAHALVAVNPRAPQAATSATEATVVGERAPAGGEGGEPDGAPVFLGPLYLLGKTMNALTIDRIDAEIEQLRFVNRVLAAGERAFGGRFLRQLNGALAEDGAPPVVPVSLLHINASEDIGRLAADFVRSARFRARSHSLLERAFARLADGEAADEADLLSYVLFDGEFTQELIALGRRDAERQHDEILGFFDRLRDTAAAARSSQS